MRNRKAKLLLIFSVLIVFFSGCYTASKVSLHNLVYLYQPEKQFAELNCYVFHTSDSTSTLFVEVLFSNLVYQKDAFTGLYTSSYSLNYKLTAGYESKDILSASSIVSGDSLNYGKNTSIVHSFNFKAKYPGDYLLEITLNDLNRQAGSTRYFKVQKSTMNGRQNFLVLNRNRELVYRNYLPDNETIRIIADDHEKESLFVNYYNRNFPVARPPYTEDKEPVFEFKPDSVFRVSLSNGESEWMTLEKPGFYHFRKDTNTHDGLTLFRFPEGS